MAARAVVAAAILALWICSGWAVVRYTFRRRRPPVMQIDLTPLGLPTPRPPRAPRKVEGTLIPFLNFGRKRPPFRCSCDRCCDGVSRPYR